MPNDELTPEEKLLQVIQNGDGAKASEKSDVASAGTEASDAVIADSAPSVVPPAATDRGSLKLADKPEESTPDEPPTVQLADNAAAASGGDMILSDDAYGEDDSSDGDEDDDTEEQEEESVAATAATPVTKKRATEADGVLRVNRLLLLAVLMIIGLIGIEIWANISARPLPSPEPGDMKLPEAVETTLPPYEQVLGHFKEKEWFHVAEDRGEGEKPKLDQSAAESFLRQNVKLVGLSKLPDGTPEALIADLIPDKMHFVQESDRLALGSAESPRLFTLKSIKGDHVVLSDGSDEYTLK